MLSLERAGRTRPVTWLSLVGLVLVPVLVAGGFLWAVWGSGDRLDRVEAAVVNLDEGTEIDGQPVPLGRQLVAGLVEGGDDVEEGQNFSWVLTDAEDADSGVGSGRYAAVITIPRNFSAAATSFGGEPADAERATIGVRTSEVAGVADGAIGQAVADTAARLFSTELTETYLDNIYLGFNDIADQFGTVAEGTDELAGGAEQLSEGVSATGEGLDELADGIDVLGASGGELATGVEGLAGGATQLAAGGAPLAEGADQLADGVSQLSDGVPALGGGARELAQGLDGYADGVRAYTGGVTELAGGLGQLNGQLQAGLGGTDLSGPSPEEVARITALVDGAASNVGGVAEGLVAAEQSVQQVARDGLPEGTIQCPAELSQDDCAIFRAGADAGAQQGAGQLTQLLQTPGPDGISVSAAIAQLDAGSAEISGSLRQVSSQLAGLSGLGDQVQQLLDGVDQLDTGASQLAAGGPALVEGADQLAGGASQLAGGVDQLGAGIAQLDTGAGELAAGVGQYTVGVEQLATGTAQLAPGVRGYTDGVAETATGTRELAEGYSGLVDGMAELATGTRELADGLAEGAEQIPTYSSGERSTLSEVVAEPVATDGDTELLPAAGSTSLLMVLALWLGALATFLVVQPVSARLWVSSRPSWQLALLSMLPGVAVAAVQAVALTVVGQLVLDLSAARVVGLLALLLVVGAAFVGVNHALAAWLGGVGRLVSVAMVVLTAGGAILSAVPAFYDVLRPFSALTPALDAVRTLVTGGAGLSDDVFGVIGWLLLAVAASVIAVLRRRSVKPAALLRQRPGVGIAT